MNFKVVAYDSWHTSFMLLFPQIQSRAETATEWSRRKTLDGSSIVGASCPRRFFRFFTYAWCLRWSGRCLPMSLCLWRQTAPHSEKSTSTPRSDV